MFYKNCLSVIRHNDLCSLTECIVTEIILGERINIVYFCNYGSSSQTPDEFNDYCQHFLLTLPNIDNTSPFCSIAMGNFNVRCRNWWAGDAN